MESLRHGIRGKRSRRPAALEPGELVWARAIHRFTDPADLGRVRPVVLIGSEGSHWRAMGLTTNPRYRDGRRRVAVPDARAVGLKTPGWLLGQRLSWTSDIDVDNHLGWIDHALADEVIDLADLTGSVKESLLAAADRHHARPVLHVTSRVEGGAA